MADADVIYSGRIEAKAGRFSRFGQRFFVLTSQELLWFEKQESFTAGKQPDKRMALSQLSAVVQPDASTPLFQLLMKDKSKWEFKWPQQEHAQPWVSQLIPGRNRQHKNKSRTKAAPAEAEQTINTNKTDASALDAYREAVKSYASSSGAGAEEPVAETTGAETTAEVPPNEPKDTKKEPKVFGGWLQKTRTPDSAVPQKVFEIAGVHEARPEDHAQATLWDSSAGAPWEPEGSLNESAGAPAEDDLQPIILQAERDIKKFCEKTEVRHRSQTEHSSGSTGDGRDGAAYGGFGVSEGDQVVISRAMYEHLMEAEKQAKRLEQADEARLQEQQQEEEQRIETETNKVHNTLCSRCGWGSPICHQTGVAQDCERCVEMQIEQIERDLQAASITEQTSPRGSTTTDGVAPGDNPHPRDTHVTPKSSNQRACGFGGFNCAFGI